MAPPLGDSLPEEMRKGLAQLNFKIGAVFKLYCHRACKEKRFVFVDVKFDKSLIALVYINSEINLKVFPTPELQAEHLLFKNEGREYLTHDSYIDCTQLVYMKRDEVYALLEVNPSIHLGHLIPSDLMDIRQKIKTSKTIPAAKKKEFGLYYG